MTTKFKGYVDAWPARSNAAHNPFQSLLSDALEKEGWIVREFSPLRAIFRRSSIWHWHWPDGQFSHGGRSTAWVRLFILILLLLKARLFRTQVIWTAHNLQGHETKHRRVEDRFWPLFYRSISGIHFISEASRGAALQKFPTLGNKPYVVTPHGHYKEVFGLPMSKDAARAVLRIDPNTPTVIFCGKIRAYKGVLDLIEAFKNIQDFAVNLVIAGAASPDEERRVRAAVSGDSRIQLIFKLLSDKEVSTVVSAADLVVLPYKRVTNSGSALLALSLNRPILASNKGSIPELAQRVGQGWVTTYEVLTAQSITDCLSSAAARSNGAVDLDFFDWRHIGGQVSALYEKVTGRCGTSLLQEDGVVGGREAED